MKLTDISSRLGLSVSTVSRALRNAEGVDTQTRTRVLAEAARAGYRGPGRQRLMKTGKPRTMLALSRNDSGAVSYEAMAGMSQAAIELNVSILTHQTPHDCPESILNPKFQPPAMRAGQLDGIVLLNEWPEPVVSELQLIYPVVSMLYDYPGCDVVGIDEAKGMRTLVSRLSGAGLPGYFGCRGGSGIHKRLRAAFRTAQAGGAPVIEVQHDPLATNASIDNGVAELRRHIRQGVRSWVCPDSASADLLTASAKSPGSRTLDELVVGVFYSGNRQSAHATQWTSLEIPSEELGIAAVRRLLHRIEHPTESIRRIFLSVDIVSSNQLSHSPISIPN